MGFIGLGVRLFGGFGCFFEALGSSGFKTYEVKGLPG